MIKMLTTTTQAPIGIERDQYWVMQGPRNENFKPVRVHYSVSKGTTSSQAPIVFLHGFGVGEFHWENNQAAIAIATGRTCYALDWIGQGRSWPDESDGLSVGAKIWQYQLIQFLEQVVQERAVLVGNSLGGFIATFVAASRPDLVAGVGLLNATPFWGFVSRNFPFWNAQLPAPRTAFLLGSTWFNALRNERTVRSLLKQVYATPDSLDDQLVQRIIQAAQSEKGPDIFTSIIFNPPPADPFDTALQTAYFDHGVPFALIYGKDDPWVTTLWGQRAFRRLQQTVPYYELTPAGHCVHHETPLATNFCLCDWLDSLFHQGKSAVVASSLGVGESRVIEELDGRKITVTHVDGQPRTLIEWTAKLIWR
eukprot:CAMPEP_0197297256 /NCGR_PEP_ID=MMETSP0890-20130614/40578_1 /TAXON_ID=44058 ORGANISM="Aureoumbra lagunensis, Strain CCMP1510" /NCGR_SAMPLE_ID=MMETSP0890 /ASSEMBLY_ACC=CAM_ASM_000533 /LENGTH=365 /DNA_ID=CAMNT_0042774307 /DNA_START=148 /DNA_END=1245 /DNA_ORIENTATION=-